VSERENEYYINVTSMHILILYFYHSATAVAINVIVGGTKSSKTGENARSEGRKTKWNYQDFHFSDDGGGGMGVKNECKFNE
jgi:hypothetical protein